MSQDELSSTQSPRDGLWVTDIPIIHHSAQDDSVATLQQARFLENTSETPCILAAVGLFCLSGASRLGWKIVDGFVLCRAQMRTAEMLENTSKIGIENG